MIVARKKPAIFSSKNIAGLPDILSLTQQSVELSWFYKDGNIFLQKNKNCIWNSIRTDYGEDLDFIKKLRPKPLNRMKTGRPTRLSSTTLNLIIVQP